METTLKRVTSRVRGGDPESSEDVEGQIAAGRFYVKQFEQSSQIITEIHYLCPPVHVKIQLMRKIITKFSITTL